MSNHVQNLILEAFFKASCIDMRLHIDTRDFFNIDCRNRAILMIENQIQKSKT